MKAQKGPSSNANQPSRHPSTSRHALLCGPGGAATHVCACTSSPPPFPAFFAVCWAWNSILASRRPLTVEASSPRARPTCRNWPLSKSRPICCGRGLARPAFSAQPCGCATVVRNAPRPRDELSAFPLPWYGCPGRNARHEGVPRDQGTQGPEALRGRGGAAT